MMPKYRLVYSSVKDKIENDEYGVNEQIPDGKSLAKEYNCSVLTVKKALDILVSEGLLVRKRGLGTFVTKMVNYDSNTKNLDMSEWGCIKRNLVRSEVTSIIEKFDIIKCDEEMAKNLELSLGDFVYNLIRVRLFDGEPRVIEYTWMPINIVKGLELKNVEGSIYYYIEKELNLNIQSSHVSINAVRPNEIEKKYFNIDDNDFLTEMIKTSFLDNADIFEYSVSRHIPKYFEFKTAVIHKLY